LPDARAGKGMWEKGSYIKSLLEAQVVFDSFGLKRYRVKYIFFGSLTYTKYFSKRNRPTHRIRFKREKT
jgi:hypothetical protein